LFTSARASHRGMAAMSLLSRCRGLKLRACGGAPVTKPYCIGHQSFVCRTHPRHDEPLRRSLFKDSLEGGRAMQLHCHQDHLRHIRAYAAPARCPHCGDIMVAPIHSEFVEGGEIRHHWECEACGAPSSTSIPMEVCDPVE
jgi:hypothetical protein